MIQTLFSQLWHGRTLPSKRFMDVPYWCLGTSVPWLFTLEKEHSGYIQKLQSLHREPTEAQQKTTGAQQLTNCTAACPISHLMSHLMMGCSSSVDLISHLRTTKLEWKHHYQSPEESQLWEYTHVWEFPVQGWAIKQMTEVGCLHVFSTNCSTMVYNRRCTNMVEIDKIICLLMKHWQGG